MSVLQNARIYHGEIRIDTEMTAVQSQFGVEEQDDTTFNDATRKQAGGLFTTTMGFEGFWESGPGKTGGPRQDEALFNDVAVEDILVSFGANNGAVGERAYFSQYMFGEYTIFDGSEVGDQHTISGGAVGRNRFVQGTVLQDEAEETASGSAAAQQLGSVGSAQSFYAGLHVLKSDGDGSQTLDVTIESDSADDFTGAETTRVTFGQVTTSATYEWATPVAGSISDDWWRAVWSIGGTGSPAFEFVVVAGII